MAEKYVKELGELESLKKQKEMLLEEMKMKSEIQKQKKEVEKLMEEMHPSAQSKLKKFLALTDKALSKVGEVGVKSATIGLGKLIAYEKKQKALEKKRGK